MTETIPPDDKLEALLLLTVNDELSKEERVELNDLLRDSEVNRIFAAHYLADQATLAHALSSDASKLTFTEALVTEAIQHQDFVEPRSQPTRLHFLQYATAALLVLMLGGLSYLAFQQSSPNRLGSEMVDAQAVATVQFADQSSGVHPNSKLMVGQILKLTDGRIKIAFDANIKLAVKAPAELVILGPNSARIKQGQITARVPLNASGFKLDTPVQRISDLGTSFGVNVRANGQTDVTVFEGEVAIGESDKHRLLAGSALKLTKEANVNLPYNAALFMNTWECSFGIDSMVGDIRFAKPEERKKPGAVYDTKRLLLIPEREGVLLPAASEISFSQPGRHVGPFEWRGPLPRGSSPDGKRNDRPSWIEAIPEAVMVDSYLLQFNPGVQPDGQAAKKKQRFATMVKFDRPVIAVIAQKDLLAHYDSILALPDSDMTQMRNRGLYLNDEITLSEDRRTIHVSLEVEDGLDQLRVLVESHFSELIEG